MQPHCHHSFQDRHGRLHVWNSGFDRPRPITCDFLPLAHGNRQVLMPGHLPIGPRTFYRITMPALRKRPAQEQFPPTPEWEEIRRGFLQRAWCSADSGWRYGLRPRWTEPALSLRLFKPPRPKRKSRRDQSRPALLQNRCAQNPLPGCSRVSSIKQFDILEQKVILSTSKPLPPRLIRVSRPPGPGFAPEERCPARSPAAR